MATDPSGRVMLPREDDELRAAVTHLVEVTRAFAAGEPTVDADATREACCEAINLMRDREWSSERALANCRRVVDAGILPLVDRYGGRDRWLEIRSLLVNWVIECYYSNDADDRASDDTKQD